MLYNGLTFLETIVSDPAVYLRKDKDLTLPQFEPLFSSSLDDNNREFFSCDRMAKVFAGDLGLDKFSRENKRFLRRAFCRQNKAFSSSISAE